MGPMVRYHPTPKPRRPHEVILAFAPELALYTPPAPRTTNVAMLVDDKEVFAALQAHFSQREGRHVPQWEVLSKVLGLALAHDELKLVAF